MLANARSLLRPSHARRAAADARPSRRIGFGRLLAEMAMIVFSILLALSVDEWRERRAHAELAATALRNIKNELLRNREMLAESIPLHRAVLAEVRAAAEDLKRNEEPSIDARLTPPNVMRVAWDTAASTQALSYIDFEMVMQLSRLYSGQEWLTRIETTWLATLTNPDFQSDENRLRLLEVLAITMQNYVGVEESLERGCAEVIAAIEKLG